MRRRAPARHGRAPTRSGQAGQAGAVGLPCASELRPSGRAVRWRGGLPCTGELPCHGIGISGELRCYAGGHSRPSCAGVGLPYIGIPCHGGGRDGTDKWVPPEIYKKTPNNWVCPFFDLITCMLCHVSTDNGVHLSEIVLAGLNRTISAHRNEFAQNRWFFAISPNIGGFKYFPRKCGGFLELTL
jgi:hypothetical protein